MNEIPLSNEWLLRYSPVMELWLKEDGILLVDDDNRIRLTLEIGNDQAMQIKSIEQDGAYFVVDPVNKRITFELEEEEEESDSRFWE
ncbi:MULTISPECIES: hypothetical protein [Exiguobacterium]|jgi:uncharacterized membrane protein YobD (UPF0266 family)|uniref:Uncharacterized protein n=2 Tax=Exiguobacterium TaxID=33986 RepID=A0ABY7X025_9BACL|nr:MULTISPECIES: hypothetical protein [Exiguobacterium]MCA0982010.1 hypothetical protein [Exiguobacterium aestuarii]MCT4787514.1 hypothetical protein [Exiguobacterium aestuarii]MDA5561569.1 hypothetical protein [Exiguobacterium sp. MMG028]MDE0562537.1 hypothetical protein [Exiguobacterium sp. B2(2022)]WDH76478.1 hypothetical protein PTI97_02855 [Exiguobacterium marinum]